MLSCWRESGAQDKEQEGEARQQHLCYCQGCKSVVLEQGTQLMSVCGRFKGPAWVLFTCW